VEAMVVDGNDQLVLDRIPARRTKALYLK
jgi:hypothetical protein